MDDAPFVYQGFHKNQSIKKTGVFSFVCTHIPSFEEGRSALFFLFNKTLCRVFLSGERGHKWRRVQPE